MRKLIQALIVGLLVGLSQAVSAETYEEGLAAYGRGDYAGALRILRPLATGGDAYAQALLGRMFQLGLGTATDYREATRWLRLAADNGLSIAQFNLGEAYYYGLGVVQNHREAMTWYLAAAKNFAMPEAAYRLGEMYRFGRGIPPDDDEARRWWQVAAERGYVDAQRAMGQIYRDGQSVTKDLVVAHMWFNLVAASSDGWSNWGAKNRGLLEAQMTPDEIRRAQSMALACEKHIADPFLRLLVPLEEEADPDYRQPCTNSWRRELPVLFELGLNR